MKIKEKSDGHRNESEEQTSLYSYNLKVSIYSNIFLCLNTSILTKTLVHREKKKEVIKHDGFFGAR